MPGVAQLEVQQSTAKSIFGPAAGPSWSPIGPNPIPNGQTQNSTVAVTGQLTVMAIDPTNPSILYVGAASGGLWRSLDGGTSFSPIFDSAQFLSIGALEIDPTNHSRLWVGTGEPSGSCDSFAGVGVYRIDNADSSPVLIGPINPVRTYVDASQVTRNVPAFNGRSISKILVNPIDPNMVFVATAGGIMGLGCDSPYGGALPPLCWEIRP